MRKQLPLILILTLLITAALPVAASDPAQAGPERVELEASDGLILVGHYYAPPESDDPAPAVLLQHHGGAQKEVWFDLVPPLQQAGYAILSVDLRGHGETGDSFAADAAIDDTQQWVAWLRAQPGVDPDQVRLVGASMGVDVGLPALADDAAVEAMVALSPALDFEGLDTASAAAELGPDRRLFLAAGQEVEAEAEAVRTLAAAAEGEVTVRLYNNGACCTYFFMFDRTLVPSILDFLANDYAADPADLPAPERIELAASDGHTLVGNFFTPESDDPVPAVLLMHQNSSQKERWDDNLLPALLDAGYAALAVDLRAHGETGGDRDWAQAEIDVQTWLDWLREQPTVDAGALNIVGASIGSNLALRGMANDADVVTTVAISPGLSYFGVTTDSEATLDGLAGRPVYLVTARRDAPSNEAVTTLMNLLHGDMLVRYYTGTAHGNGMFMLEDSLAPSIVGWLDAQN